MNGVLIAAAVVGILGIIIGIFLGVSGAKFEVKVDERETLVREQLPGNNCGGCGYAGCDACAKAIVEGKAPVNACAGCSEENLAVISSVMGVEAEASEKKVAYVKCSGDCDKAKTNYVYTGIEDCKIAAQMQGGGAKACSYGCLGYGSCKKACPYNAITIVNGLPVVDEEKCVGCGSCVVTCPKQLMALRPVRKRTVTVACNSPEKGKPVMDACQAGCIGCTLCTKECPFGAITMNGNIPVIDYEKCNGCGKCAMKCPKKVIKLVQG